MSNATLAAYGRLGADPREHETRKGGAMATAGLAVDVPDRTRDAEEGATETLWFSVAAFGRVAEDLARHAKGDPVSVSGRLQFSRYQARDGEERGRRSPSQRLHHCAGMHGGVLRLALSPRAPRSPLGTPPCTQQCFAVQKPRTHDLSRSNAPDVARRQPEARELPVGEPPADQAHHHLPPRLPVVGKAMVVQPRLQGLLTLKEDAIAAVGDGPGDRVGRAPAAPETVALDASAMHSNHGRKLRCRHDGTGIEAHPPRVERSRRTEREGGQHGDWQREREATGGKS